MYRRRFFVQALLNSVVPFTLIAWAQQSVEAGLATILNSASPIFVFLATWGITRHEKVTPQKLAGVAAGFLGIALIVGASAFGGIGQQALPQLAIVLATVCYAGTHWCGYRGGVSGRIAVRRRMDRHGVRDAGCRSHDVLKNIEADAGGDLPYLTSALYPTSTRRSAGG